MSACRLSEGGLHAFISNAARMRLRRSGAHSTYPAERAGRAWLRAMRQRACARQRAGQLQLQGWMRGRCLQLEALQPFPYTTRWPANGEGDCVLGMLSSSGGGMLGTSAATSACRELASNAGDD